MTTDLRAWLGRERTEEDRLGLAPVRGMLALLDRNPERSAEGDAVPPGWHWLYFNPAARRSELDEDGHERRGGFLPPVPLPRRMWAGGRLRFERPLEIGRRASRRSVIGSVEEKEGRSGRLVFVTVRHRVSTGEGVAVEEEQDLVYREAPDAGARAHQGPERPGEAVWSERWSADVLTLFRFSALTFNGHRIHYDHPYATGVEGYPGLVVHGPLLALLLLDAGARWSGREPRSFSYRAVSPVFCDEEVRIEGRAAVAGDDRHDSSGDTGGGLELWAAHPDRGVAMRAEWR